MADALTDQTWNVRALMGNILNATFTQEAEAGTFLWDLLMKALKDKQGYVRGLALRSCIRHYQTFAKSVDEAMEFVREFAFSSDSHDRWEAGNVIVDLIPKALGKSEEILVLWKALCRDPNTEVRANAARSFEDIVKSSWLRRKDLFSVAFDLFKDGYPNVQLHLLPFLFSFDKKEYLGIDEVNEWITNCQDLNARVQEIAVSCSKANALLSEYTIEEIHDRFYDQDKEVRLEIVRKLEVREIESNKEADAIAAMAIQCLKDDYVFKPSYNLLELMSKTELFPRIILEQLAKIEGWDIIQLQPLFHLLEYYWSTKDSKMIEYIAKKLLLTPVIFERKGESDMVVTLREKGANMKQTAPIEVVQDFLLLCNDFLKKEYGLDFSE